MKKMKYLFTFLIALCFVPNIVSAKQDVYYKGYKVGDQITVTLDKEGKVKGKFFVIETSSEGTDKDVADDFDYKATKSYHTVKAIYAGSVGKSAYASDTGEVGYENSIARSNLVIRTQDLKWINYQTIGLLTLKDLNTMIKSLPQEEQKEIYGNGEVNCKTDENGKINCEVPLNPIGSYNLTALRKYLPFVFTTNPYWLGEATVYSTPGCEPGQSCAQVVVNHGAAMTVDGYKRIFAKAELDLRPVITIHKGFVEGGMVCNCTNCEEEKYCPNDPKISIQECLDKGNSESYCVSTLCEKKEAKVCPNDSKISIQSCIDDGKSEEACIKKLCPGSGKTENPKTGSYLSLFGIIIAGIVASCVYVATRNKNYLKKIK